MIKYAVTLRDFSDDYERAEAHLNAFRRSKIKAVELSLFPNVEPDSLLTKIHGEYARKLKNEKIAEIASIHLPFMGGGKSWDMSLADEDARKDVSMRLQQMIRDNADLFPANVTMHSSMEPPLEEHPARIECVCRTIEELLPLADEIGFSLNVEYLPRRCIGNCTAELEKIISRFDAKHVNLCMDVNHVMDKYNELPGIISHLAPRIRTFHFNDYDGIDEKHWFPGQGIINWTAVMGAIKAMKNDPLLIFETSYQLGLGLRQTDPAWHLKQVADGCFFLENCAEMEERIRNFELR